MRDRILAVIAPLLLLLVITSGRALPVGADSGPSPEECAAITGTLPDACWATLGISPPVVRVIMSTLEQYPPPNVIRLLPDEAGLTERNYARVIAEEPVTIYDSPDGQPVETLDVGFNFVSVEDRIGDWLQIDIRKWVRAEVLRRVEPSSFAGVLLPEPVTLPFGWVLGDVRPSPWPNINPPDDTPVIPRYTLVNIFASARVGDWIWYLVGPGQWIHQTRMAIVRSVPRPWPVSGRWIAVDLYEQTLAAYDGDRMIFATLVSTGLPDWPTNEGLFRIYRRVELTVMSGAAGQPDFYYLQDVPWTMYFDQDISLHGTYWHDGFGYRHSHGCVNLSFTDARWLYEWTEEGAPNAYVYVYSTGEYR